VTSIASVAFGPQIIAAAQHHNLSPTLLAAVAAQETGGPGSSSGANVVGDGGHGHGVFQIDDRYHPFAATRAASDPAQNADYAAGLLSGLLQKFGGNVREALSAYNSGSPGATGTITDWGGGLRLGYADSVLRHEAAFGTTARDAAIPDLAGTAARVNGLRDAATATSVPISADAAQSATPPPAQRTAADRAHTEAALTQDYYADGDDAESKGA
jgi:hypothetical protein